MKFSRVKQLILPHLVWKSLVNSIGELNYFRRYTKILNDLKADGSLEQYKINLEENGDMYIGINLNPELLVYEMDAQEPVEMRFLTDKMKVYTDFFSRMQILDYMIADYERVQTSDYYGYVVKLNFNFRSYSRPKLIYSIAYLASLTSAVIAGILALV
jgi:hypothetical protein